MSARLSLVSLLLLASWSSASSRREYVVRWQREGELGSERRELVEQADLQLRDALRRCGAAVLDGEPTPTTIVLRPRLEVLPGGLLLRVVGLRDEKLLGTIATKATGASRRAQVRAVVSRVCDEASRLE
ncbi:MAG: hypothetical protein ACOZQL_39590 [Myxococcota bacterium]